MNLFSHKEISDGTFVVTENYSAEKRFSIGVVVGKDKVLVIDSGAGMAGDLRDYIEKIVGKHLPKICICTHGHSDTIGAAALFDEAYLKKEDVGAYPEATFYGKRLTELKMFSKGNPEMIKFGSANMISTENIDWKDINDGDKFDLGGVVAEVREIPGHTKGSIAIRITRNNSHVTFVGDAFSSGLNHFLRSNASELADYALRLKDMMDCLDWDEPIICTHSHAPMTKEAGYAVAKACMDVAMGMTDGDPAFRFGQFDPNITGPDFRMHFADNYYIAYNADLM